MCSIVENENESYNKLHQVKGLVPVAHTCACSNTLQIWLYLAITCVCQVARAAGICGSVRNVCDWHQCFDLVELIVALLCIPDSAAHACGLRNLTDTCNSQSRPYLRSIEAYTSVHSCHQSFDLVELVVALVFIFNNVAHIRGLSYFNYLCSSLGRPYIQIIGVCTSVHDQYRPPSLL